MPMTRRAVAFLSLACTLAALGGVQRERLADGWEFMRADDPKKDRIVVLSAYVKKVLAKYGRLNVQTIEELAAGCL